MGTSVSLVDSLSGAVIQKRDSGRVIHFQTDNPFAGVCIAAKEPIRVQLNHEEINCKPEDGSAIIPCVFQPQSATCRIETEGMAVIVRFTAGNKDVSAGEIAGLYENFRERAVEKVADGISIEKYVDLLLSKIPLVNFNKHQQEGLNNDIVFDIKKVATEDLAAIMAQPHTQLVESERIERVERAMRYNAHSVRHLASHSELWRGEGLSGVYPEKILSLVYEDDFDNYENCFLRMAVDKMAETSMKERGKSEEKFSEEMGNAKRKKEYTPKGALFDQVKRDAWSNLYSLLSANTQKEDEDEDEIVRQREKRRQIFDTIDNAISQVKSHKIYETLRRKNDLPLPIQMTNALTKKEHYYNVFSLWEKMRAGQQGERFGKKNAGENNEAPLDYAKYVASVLAWGIKKLQGNEGNKFDGYVDDKLSRVTLCAEMRGIRIVMESRFAANTVPYIDMKIAIPEDRELELKKKDCAMLIRNPVNGMTWNEEKNVYYVTIPQTTDSQNCLRTKLKGDAWKQNARKITDKPRSCFRIAVVPMVMIPPKEELKFRVWMADRARQLGKWAGEKQFDSVLLTYPLTSQDLDELKGVTNSGVVHTLETLPYAINYGNEVDETRNSYFGDYRFAVLPISRKELSSPMRIIKYLRMQMCRLQVEWQYQEDLCPVCGSKKVGEMENGGYHCYNCQSRWNGKWVCPVCRTGHPWISMTPKTRERIEQEELLDPRGKTPIGQMIDKEITIDYSVITGYDGNTGKYLCPHCGE